MNNIKKYFKKLISIIKKKKYSVIAYTITFIIFILCLKKLGLAPAFIVLLLLGTVITIITIPKKKKNKGKTSFKEVIKTLLIVGMVLIILGLLAAMVFFAYIVKTAPKFEPEKLYNKEATFLYTIDGEEFAKLGTDVRQNISYNELSESLIDAIVAAEDSRYFQHSGVDLPRFIKASLSQVIGHGGGGASTLTMQVSKNKLTSNKDEGIAGIIRKFSDIYISVFQIETHYTKEQIMEFYVNSNYLGGGANGVELASLNYFNKHAKDLNVAESAMIAGLFQAPYAYDPYIYPEDCEERRQTILYLMLRHGYINEEEYNIAKEFTVQKLLVNEESTNNDKQYQDFINTVVQEVIDKTGNNPYEVPMKIYTTMNKSMQDHMTDVMTGKAYKWENDKVQAGAVILDVKTGAIVAVGGNRNTVARGDNYGVNLKRQIGSTAKPLYEYGPAIEYYNYSTYTPIADEHYTYSSGMEIKNWDKEYDYLIPVQEAIRDSRNIPALKTFRSLSNKKILEFSTNLGLSPEIEGGAVHEAHSLGGYNGESPLTLSAAYAAFSNGGWYIEPHSFTVVEFTDADEVYERRPITRKAMSAETAYIMTKMLEATAPYAAGYVNGVNFAAKTGTTNYDDETLERWNLPDEAVNDKWVASYNDSYAITVWYGYTQLSSEYYLRSDNYRVKDVLRTIAQKVYTKKSVWEKPNGVVEVVVENATKLNANPNIVLASENTPAELKVTAYFKRGFEPTEVSTRFNKLETVTNVNYDIDTDTLSWDPIELNNYFDEEYLKSIYSKYFQNEEDLGEQIKKIIEYNTNVIGDIIYDIYTKDDEGNLTLIDSVEETEYVYPITESTTFVIKTNYSKLKTCESDESEFVMTIIPDVITASLNGATNVEVELNDTFDDEVNPVVVMKNGLIDITDDCTTTITVLKKSDSTTLDSLQDIDTTSADEYVISYHISCDNYRTTLRRNVKIVDPSN